MTMRNNNGTSLFYASPPVVLPPDSRPVVIVRQHAMGLSGLHGAAYPLPSIVDVMTRNIDSNTRVYTDPLPAPCPRLRIDTKLEESTEDRQTDKRCRSMGSEACPAREGRPRSSGSFVSPTRFESPVSNVCDGWCRYNPFARRSAVSVLAFSCLRGCIDRSRISCRCLRVQIRNELGKVLGVR